MDSLSTLLFLSSLGVALWAFVSRRKSNGHASVWLKRAGLLFLASAALGASSVAAAIGNVAAALMFFSFFMTVRSHRRRNGQARRYAGVTAASLVAATVFYGLDPSVSSDSAQPADLAPPEALEADAEPTAAVAPDAEAEKASADAKAKADAEAKAAADAKVKAKAEADAKAAEEKAKAEAARPKLGHPIAVGQLSYVVESASEVSVIPSDNEYIPPAKTNGVFVIVSFTVSNQDDTARSISDSLLMLRDEDGKEYQPTEKYEVQSLLGDDYLIWEELNPGLSHAHLVAFEIPAETPPYVLVLASGVGWAGGEEKELPLP